MQFPHFTLTSAEDIFTIAPQKEEKKKTRKVREDFKRTPNPYLLFCKERRTQLHRENPETKSRDITKVLAEEWKNMGKDEKEKYQMKYKTLIECHSNEEEKGRKKEVSISKLLGKWKINIQSESGETIVIPAVISQIF